MVILPTLRAMPDGLVGCGECVMRIQFRQRAEYAPPYLFESITAMNDPDGGTYKVRGTPGAYELRDHHGHAPWITATKPYLLCKRCYADANEYVVFAAATGEFVPGMGKEYGPGRW